MESEAQDSSLYRRSPWRFVVAALPPIFATAHTWIDHAVSYRDAVGDETVVVVRTWIVASLLLAGPMAFVALVMMGVLRDRLRTHGFLIALGALAVFWSLARWCVVDDRWKILAETTSRRGETFAVVDGKPSALFESRRELARQVATGTFTREFRVLPIPRGYMGSFPWEDGATLALEDDEVVGTSRDIELFRFRTSPE